MRFQKKSTKLKCFGIYKGRVFEAKKNFAYFSLAIRIPISKITLIKLKTYLWAFSWPNDVFGSKTPIGENDVKFIVEGFVVLKKTGSISFFKLAIIQAASSFSYKMHYISEKFLLGQSSWGDDGCGEGWGLQQLVMSNWLSHSKSFFDLAENCETSSL